MSRYCRVVCGKGGVRAEADAGSLGSCVSRDARESNGVVAFPALDLGVRRATQDAHPKSATAEANRATARYREARS